MESNIWNIYLFGKTVLIPTLAKTEAGFYVEIEAVCVANKDDSISLLEVLKTSLSICNPNVPTPVFDKGYKPIILKFTTAKSYSEFEKKAFLWKIRLEKEIYKVGKLDKDNDKGWKSEPALWYEFDKNSTIEQVADYVSKEISQFVA